MSNFRRGKTTLTILVDYDEIRDKNPYQKDLFIDTLFNELAI